MVWCATRYYYVYIIIYQTINKFKNGVKRRGAKRKARDFLLINNNMVSASGSCYTNVSLTIERVYFCEKQVCVLL